MYKFLYKLIFGFMVSLLTIGLVIGSNVNLDQANNDIHNQESLQNGAKLFMNYCLGCHSISYMRYGRIAKDLNISEDLMAKNLIFSDAKIGESIHNVMPKESADWFGVTPPDLSLTARSLGTDWIYTYLHSFYADDSRPFGVNNHVLVGTSMPNILADRKQKLNPKEFDKEVRDITNFLDYVSEPIQLTRTQTGINVLIFLLILLILTFLLKKEYWQDVKYGRWRAKK